MGVTDASAESLARFDAAYLGQYPYLVATSGEPCAALGLLEIGLGYGTLSGQLIARGAPAPRRGHRRRDRWRWCVTGSGSPGRTRSERVVQGSALDLPSRATPSTSSTRSAAFTTPATFRAR